MKHERGIVGQQFTRQPSREPAEAGLESNLFVTLPTLQTTHEESRNISRSQRVRDPPPPPRPQLRPSFTLRGPSQTERDGGQGHAFPTVRKGTGGRTWAFLISRVATAPVQEGRDRRPQGLA